MSIQYAFTCLDSIAIWAIVATMGLTAILAGSQGYGLTRLSLPFLAGTMFTGNRHRAAQLGFFIYLIGGFLFAFVYFLVLAELGRSNWWIGGSIGILHALFLLVAVLPVLPHVHPRMASEYDPPSSQRRLEPPGFFGLNYGYRTPLTAIVGHAVYGAVLGFGLAGPLQTLWQSAQYP